MTNDKYIDNSEFDIRTIFGGDATSNARESDLKILDKDWVKSRFMVPDSDLAPDVVALRYTSTGSLKPYDTSIGGNIMINPRPQYNALTDPKVDNLISKLHEPTLDPNLMGTGMGEGYSGTIDDNQQTVFFEFGMPKFNSASDFFFRAVDYGDSVLANTGRPATFYNIGKGVGKFVGFVAFPVITISIMITKFAAQAIFGESRLKFYYMKPNMPTYWSVVNTLVTQLVTEKGLLAPVFMEQSESTKTNPGKKTTIETIGLPMQLAQGDIDILNEMIPGIINEDTNYIDIFAIVTKGQRLAIHQKLEMYRRLEAGLDDPYRIDPTIVVEPSFWDGVSNTLTFGSYLKDINQYDNSKGDTVPEKPEKKIDGVDAGNTSLNTVDGLGDKFATGLDKTYKIITDMVESEMVQNTVKSFDSSLRHGGAYAVFGVDYVGSVSESFNNTTTTISLGDKAKQLSGRTRSLSYDLARGNVFGDVVSDATDAVKDLLAGALEGVTMGFSNVLQTINGGAYVDMPKRWEDSSTSFPSHTYTMELRSPYNSFLSQLQNIYIPTCMILAGVAPLATGKSSYTSPMLCSLFSKGVERIQMGMITSVTITRGTTNLGFDKRRNPLAIDISFTVTDFSNIIAAPVNPSIFTDVFNPAMEDDTPLGNYMSVLGSRDLITNKYSTHRIPMRLSRRAMRFSQTFNTDRYGYVVGTLLQDTVGAFVSARSLPEAYNN